MPPATSSWRLASGIALDPIVIGREHPPNWAVEELAARPLRDDQVQIRARLRNWSGDADRPVEAKLVINEAEVASRSRTLLPGSASQIAFSHPWDGLQPLTGYVEIAADALTRDDRRYFALNPQQRHRVAVVPERGTRRSYDRLVRAAVPKAVDLPWDLTSTSWSKLARQLDEPRDKPRIVIAADLNDVDERLEEKLQTYIRDGGHLFLPLSPRTSAAPLNRLLGPAAGVRLEGTRFPSAEVVAFAQLAWVDLEHRIFYAFRGARFNDFSALRFYNYHLLHCVAPAAVLARFRTESAESDPAIVEVTRGAGSILLWAGGIDLDWSTLPKSPRFVPLLHETLHYLTAERSSRPDYTVGDPATLPMREWDAPPPWQADMLSSGGEVQKIALKAGDRRHLELPGLLRWRPADYAAEERVEAINIAAAESNPARLSPAEFALRLCDAPTALRAADHATAEQTAQREYGRAAVGLLFGLLLLESWYTAHLARQTDEEKS